MNTTKWVRRRDNMPVAYLTVRVQVDPSFLVASAAEHFELDDDGNLRSRIGQRRMRISRQSLEAAITADYSASGDRMDWDYDEESFEAAKRECARLYPEWAAHIAELTYQ